MNLETRAKKGALTLTGRIVLEKRVRGKQAITAKGVK